MTLVSPPALLYAIPVERLVSLDAATTINAWFLAVVALWRVGLLFLYLRRLARFRAHQVVVAGLLPLTAVVTVLFMLNLEHVTFSIMGGIRDPSPNDDAYGILFLLMMVSYLAIIPLLFAYLILIVLASDKRRRRQ